MEKNPTYKEIKAELEASLQRALLLPLEQDRVEFVASASLNLQQQLQTGLLNQAEYEVLSRKLSLFAKEAYSANDLADDLWTKNWLLH